MLKALALTTFPNSPSPNVLSNCKCSLSISHLASSGDYNITKEMYYSAMCQFVVSYVLI